MRITGFERRAALRGVIDAGHDADATLLCAIQRAHGALDAPMFVLTHAGSEVSMSWVMALSTAWLLRRGRRREALFMLAAGGGALLLGRTLRLLFRRQRPRGTAYRCERPKTYSFPSGHAMGSAGVLLAGLHVLESIDAPEPLRRRAALCSSLFAPGVALSRVYWGVHYPSDVVAGALAALLWNRFVRRCFAGRARHAPPLQLGTPAEVVTTGEAA
jgi:membrane-associated phospholipid phosphatase